MTDQQIAEIKAIFKSLKKIAPSIVIKENRQYYHNVYLNIRSEEDFVAAIGVLGQLGAFYNVQGTPRNCKISIVNYNEGMGITHEKNNNA